MQFLFRFLHFARLIRSALRFVWMFALCPAAVWGSPLDTVSIEPPKECGQIVMVLAPNWSSTQGILQRAVRSHKGWERVGPGVPVLLGRRGLAWDGGSPIEKGAPKKTEGDERSPAGIFLLGPAFGRAKRAEVPWLRLPYRQLSPTTEAIDDPESRYYGQIVERESIAHPDWRSSEHMGHVSAYELGVVIAANPEHHPRGGSCIFLHLWLPGWKGTSGCTAMHRGDLEELLRWLDPHRHPLLVQLPVSALGQSTPGF